MAGYSPSAGPVTSQGDPAKKVNWSALNTTQSTGYDGGNEGVSQSPFTAKQTTAEANKSAANASKQAGGYLEASSWGRSRDASTAYLAGLRNTQAGISGAQQAAARGVQESQLAGARELGRLGGNFGNQAAGYASRFGSQQQADTVARQMAASDLLYGVGRGTEPSIAQMQMQQGQEQALAANLALAGSGRGGSSGAMLDQALRQNAAQQQQMVVQGAMARAQEQQAAMQAAAAIDASRYGQQAQSAGIGQQYSLMEAQAAQNALAARTGAYTTAADINLGYGGLGRSYEDLVYGIGEGESERYMAGLTGQAAQQFQEHMANKERGWAQDDADLALIGKGFDTVGQGYSAWSQEG